MENMAKKSPSSKKSKRKYKERPDSDRRVRQAERMARILKVLELIQGRSRWNAKALADELECDERTIYRDLKTLEFAGVPWYFDESACCYRVRSDYRFPVFRLSDDELIGQAVASAVSKAPGLDVGKGVRATTRKLAAKSDENAERILADAESMISVLGLQLADHSRHHDAIRTVQWALLDRKQITGRYESPYEEKPVTLRLHPFRLVLIKQAWYVIARTIDATEPRTYRVARFKTLRMLDTAADVPDAFDLKDYFGNAWAVYRGDKTYDVELWFDPDAAKIVTETNWHHTQRSTKHHDGSVTLKFQIDGLEEVLHWILSWAGRVRVIKPTQLQDRYLQKLSEAIALQKAK